MVKLKHPLQPGPIDFNSELITEHFEQIVEETLIQVRELLLIKGKEYRRNNNPYHNFETGSDMSGMIPEKVLFGFQLKHLISMQDIRNDLEKGIIPCPDKVNEKWNDALVYTLIEKAMILHRNI